jgi:hypothetical protein
MRAATLNRTMTEKRRQYTVQDSLDTLLAFAKQARELPPSMASKVAGELENVANKYHALITDLGPQEKYSNALQGVMSGLEEIAKNYDGFPIISEEAHAVHKLVSGLEKQGGFAPYIPSEDAHNALTRYSQLRTYIDAIRK